MCYPRDEFRVGQSDVLLGWIEQSPVYIGGAQFATWQHTQLIIDAVHGRGGMFSLDNATDQRFLVRGRAFTDDELDALEASAT